MRVLLPPCCYLGTSTCTRYSVSSPADAQCMHAGWHLLLLYQPVLFRANVCSSIWHTDTLLFSYSFTHLSVGVLVGASRPRTDSSPEPAPYRYDPTSDRPLLVRNEQIDFKKFNKQCNRNFRMFIRFILIILYINSKSVLTLFWYFIFLIILINVA